MLAKLFQPFVGIGRFQFLQRRDPSRHGQGISTQRASLINRSEWREAIHDFGSASESSHRQAAANDFSEATQVRGNSKTLLRPARTQPEASHDLIEYQQSAIARRHLAQEFQVTGFGQIHPGIARDWLKDHPRNVAWIGCKSGPHHLHIIERQHDRVLRKSCRHSLAVWMPKSQRPRTCLD